MSTFHIAQQCPDRGTVCSDTTILRTDSFQKLKYQLYMYLDGFTIGLENIVRQEKGQKQFVFSI